MGGLHFSQKALFAFLLFFCLSCLQTPESGGPSSMDLDGNTPASYSSMRAAGAGISGTSQGLQIPICGCSSPGCRVTSGFGMRRHPILGGRRMHHGVDMAAPTGTPVRAADDGVVTDTTRSNSGWGNRVVIRHNKNLRDRRGRSVSSSGFETQYNHLQQIRVSRGQRVRKGAVVGTVGATGMATGPHLCMNVRANGQYVDPMRFMSSGDMQRACSSGRSTPHNNQGQEVGV